MFGNGKRFDEVQREGHMWGTARILRDKETGVHYLCLGSGDQLSTVTPLLDENGRIVISRDE